MLTPHLFIKGVIKNGGAQPNVIPEETELEYYLRTPSDLEMQVLKDKVTGCVQAAAMATGCSVRLFLRFLSPIGFCNKIIPHGTLVNSIYQINITKFNICLKLVSMISISYEKSRHENLFLQKEVNSLFKYDYK